MGKSIKIPVGDITDKSLECLYRTQIKKARLYVLSRHLCSQVTVSIRVMLPLKFVKDNWLKIVKGKKYSREEIKWIMSNYENYVSGYGVRPDLAMPFKEWFDKHH